MYLMLAVSTLLVIALVFIFWLRKPFIHSNIKLKKLDKYFNILLKRGYDQGYMIIYVKKKNKEFVQFIKSIDDKNGKISLKLIFPLVKWSKKKYYVEFKNMLIKENITYDIYLKNEENPIEYTVLDCGTDIGMCLKITKQIFKNIYNYNEQDISLKVYFVNVSPLKESIDNL